MFDSIRASAIPADAQMVAGYVAPSVYAWSAEDFARFPRAAHVRIAVAGSPPDWRSASVIDVESGAFSPADAAYFIPRRNAMRKGTATVYADMSHLDYIGKACAGMEYAVWAAWWAAYPSPEEIAAIRSRLRPGARLVAVQYKNVASADYDISAVIDPAWHSAPV